MTVNLRDYEAGEPFDGDYEQELARLQRRLAHLQAAHIVHGKRSLIVLEGWDAAGKGGIIRRLTAEWDPRYFEVWPIAAPSAEEKAHHFLWRFWKRLPGDQDIVVFDRSWYGRVLVERVENFCGETDWKRAYDEINAFEAQLRDDGTAIVKLFLHITQDTQDKRLRDRIEHPWKRWKINAEDFRNRARRKDYLRAIADMLRETDTRWAPWTLIDGNNKPAARIAALRHIVTALEKHVPSAPPPVNEKLLAQARDALGPITLDGKKD